MGCFRKNLCQYLHIDNSTDLIEIQEVEVIKYTIIENTTFSCENEKNNKDISIQAKEPEKAPNDNVEKEALETKLSCPICKYNCKTNSMMKKHFNSKHEGHLKCSICDSKLSSADSLLAQGAYMHAACFKYL